MDVVPRQEDWASQATCMCVNTCVHVHACMHIINRSHPSHKSLMMEAEMVSKTLEIHSILSLTCENIQGGVGYKRFRVKMEAT